jgi:hypothetical protein
MKVQLDFVRRNDIHNDSTYDDDGPMQLMRLMPDQLRNYVTTQDYEDFCIQKIDPLLEALHETEKKTSRFWYCCMYTIMAMLLIVGLRLFIMIIYDENMKNYFKWTAILCLFALFVATSKIEKMLESCKFADRKLHEAIRQECRNMSDRCNAKSRAMDPNNCCTYWFELAMRRRRPFLLDYKMTVSHINVSVAERNHKDDDNNSNHYYEHLTD